MAVYFVFVLGIGAVLKRYTRTSTDFFLAGRAIPAWVCGLAFLSANLGAQEVMGMAAFWLAGQFPPGCAVWLSCPPIWGRKRSWAWRPRVRNTVSLPAISIGLRAIFGHQYQSALEGGFVGIWAGNASARSAACCAAGPGRNRQLAFTSEIRKRMRHIPKLA